MLARKRDEGVPRGPGARPTSYDNQEIAVGATLERWRICKGRWRW